MGGAELAGRAAWDPVARLAEVPSQTWPRASAFGEAGVRSDLAIEARGGVRFGFGPTIAHTRRRVAG
jgi:hypothetical protein